MRQQGLTVIVRILPGRQAALQALLNKIGTQIEENPYLDFYSLETVHFMRWVVLPEDNVRGEDIGPQLVLSTNYDGDEDAHLKELVSKGLKALQAIYVHCEGFPENGGAQALKAYLLAHKVKNAAFYCGHVGRTVKQILEERKLRDGIQSHLQTSNPSQNWQGHPATTLRTAIADVLLKSPAFSWARQVYQVPFLQRFGIAVLGAAVLLILALSVLAIVLGASCNLWLTLGIAGGILVLMALFILGWFRNLRKHEQQDTANFVPSPRDSDWVASLNQREDYRIQNQITHLVAIKPGTFRQYTLRFVLWAINLLARTVFNRGNLGGIPSIHFARWAIIDGGKRLLFFSNFDGSWESYLGDFIDKAAIGLTGVWSNTEGFPPTRKLVFEGARNSVEFKAWVRRKQIETQVWYSAYKTLTVQNINNDTEIRMGLAKNLNEKKGLEWLQRL